MSFESWGFKTYITGESHNKRSGNYTRAEERILRSLFLRFGTVDIVIDDIPNVRRATTIGSLGHIIIGPSSQPH